MLSGKKSFDDKVKFGKDCGVAEISYDSYGNSSMPMQNMIVLSFLGTGTMGLSQLLGPVTRSKYHV